MRKMKMKSCTLALAIALAMSSMTACSSKAGNTTATPTPGVEASQDAMFAAGTYTSKVTGMHDMTVTVTFSENEIKDINVEHSETPGVGEPAVSVMTDKVLNNQSIGIDGVSGATLTSTAIMNGIKECMTQAGATDATISEFEGRGEAAKEKAEDAEYTADVVVIGAGGAGMAAAVTASQNGANVIVIEKSGSMGGNTILSGGAFNAVEDGSEMAASTNDSVELHYTQTFNGGDQQAKPELVRILVENGWDAVEWLKDLGMEFYDVPTTVAGGLWQRGQKPVEPEGTGFFIAYQNYMNQNSGLQILYYTEATQLIMEDGVVTGVICEGETGNTVTVKANNGVVLATGGFAGNVEMRTEALEGNDKWPALDESVKTTNTTLTARAAKMKANPTSSEELYLLMLRA